jgi:erythromycin esterase-like protein
MNFKTADVRAICDRAIALDGSHQRYAQLIESVQDCSTVLIGSASYGTHEFYRERSHITQQLIEHHGFSGVVIEGDWPAAWRVNLFVQGASADGSAVEALDSFTQFPSWVWRNAEVLEFISWLHQFNQDREQAERVGFFGLDGFNLHRSASAVIDYLEEFDSRAATRARQRFLWLDECTTARSQYGPALELPVGCESEALELLLDVQQSAMRALVEHADLDPLAADAAFFARQNAVIVHEAEHYYRTVLNDPAMGRNLRENHMAQTLDALHEHLLESRGRSVKTVVWAHNSHVGDARATEQSAQGIESLGQISRERSDRECALIGFTTSQGTVTAAPSWGRPPIHLTFALRAGEALNRFFTKPESDSSSSWVKT